MQPCYTDLNKKIDNTQKIALKEFVLILKDKEWHELFEFHDKHRISPVELIKCIQFLQEYELIETKGESIRLSQGIDNNNVLLLNRLMKTDRPHILRMDKL
jgi:hypothetical protein